jgi:hypothetical protein
MTSGVTGLSRILGLSVLLLGLCWSAQGRAESLNLQVTPGVVEIGAFYQGQAVTVTGTIPLGTEAVVEVLGRTGQQQLMRKGRRGGLWMNVGELDISGVPSLYMVMSTSPSLLAAANREAPWGFAAIKQHLTFSGNLQPSETAEFREQFLVLKKSEKLYASYPGALKASRAKGDLMQVTGTFWLPANVKPDLYQVCLAAVQQGQIIKRQCIDLKVQMVGFPALFSSLAYEHSAWYGILAVLIAIFTGFFMGYLFKGGGGH